jgi:hypothetical protein
MRQGERVSEAFTKTVEKLLRDSELPMAVIATRLHVSASCIADWNERLNIRRYEIGQSRRWIVGGREVFAE